MYSGVFKVIAVFVATCAVIYGAMMLGGDQGGFGTSYFWVACGLIFATPLIMFWAVNKLPKADEKGLHPFKSSPLNK